MTVRLVLLGGFHGRLATGAAVSVPQKKARALLAYLALRPGEPSQREKLATLLWGDSGQARARSSLRQSLAVLRRAFSGTASGALVLDAKAVALLPQAVDVDVVTFERLVAEGTPEALASAVALYQGELLEGIDAGAPAFEEWLAAQRERLRELALEAHAKLLQYEGEAGLIEPAIQTALRLLAIDPLQEAVHRALMRLYARQGRRPNALRQYQLCVAVLQRELGVEPEPETRQAYQEILQQRLSAVPKAEKPATPARAQRRMPARTLRVPPSLEPPLVGREAELAALNQALADACDAHGRVALVLGEAGIGKTRLMDEVCATATRSRCRVLVGRCYETERILPFAVWVDVLRAGLASCEERVLDRLGAPWQAELARLLPELSDRGLKPEGPADDYLRLFGAVAQMIETLALECPLALIFEDFHWADEMSVRLLGFISRRLAKWPVLLVVSARDEDLVEAGLLNRLFEELRGEPQIVRLALAPLPRGQTQALVRLLAREGTRQEVIVQVADQAWAASEGNPFVVVEVMRALQDGQALEGPARLLPASVRDLIAVRLERLSERARALLAVAAVVGREFDFTLLQRAAGIDARRTAEDIEELVRRRILHSVDARLDFVHGRIRDTAYEQLLPPRRRLLHARVAQTMEAMYAGQPEPHYGTLGLHYFHGAVWDKASRYLRQAGASAVVASANREAVAYFDRALEALAHLPEGRSKLEESYSLQMYRAGALYALGELQRIVDQLAETEALAGALDDRVRLGRVAALKCGCLTAMGEQGPAIQAGELALALAEPSGNLAIQIEAAVLLGFAHTGLGDFPRAIDFQKKTSALLDGQPIDKRFGLTGLPAVFWRAWLTLPLAELGMFSEAAGRGAEAVRIARAAAQPYSLALAHAALGQVRLVKGDFAAGIRELEQSLSVCRDYEISVLSPLSLAALGSAYAFSGRVGDALALLQRAIVRAEGLHIMVWHSRRMTQLGECHLLAGHVSEAAAAAERALSLADRHGERAHRAYALRLVADIALRRRRPDLEVAGYHLSRALGEAEALGMKPLAARCRLDLGRLSHRAGDRSKARDSLALARRQLAAMRMRYWVKQVDAELARMTA